MLKNIVLLCLTILNASGTKFAKDNHWEGNWFPHSPNTQDTNPIITIKNHMRDAKHGIRMGVRNADCDDGESNLVLDWNMNPDNYTCFDSREVYKPNSCVHPVHSIEHIPKFYSALHKCMNESIEYNEVIPTFGTHRPLWAVYGEYTFLPRQRWVHNLEHGAVVMLYHPCADQNEINLLKSIVKSCLYKHIITAYNLLSPIRPLALVTWGHRLEMSKVSKTAVVKFIKQHALQAPESLFQDGQYSLMLTEKAEIISDNNDSILCPNDLNILK